MRFIMKALKWQTYQWQLALSKWKNEELCRTHISKNKRSRDAYIVFVFGKSYFHCVHECDEMWCVDLKVSLAIDYGLWTEENLETQTFHFQFLIKISSSIKALSVQKTFKSFCCAKSFLELCVRKEALRWKFSFYET